MNHAVGYSNGGRSALAHGVAALPGLFFAIVLVCSYALSFTAVVSLLVSSPTLLTADPTCHCRSHRAMGPTGLTNDVATRIVSAMYMGSLLFCS